MLKVRQRFLKYHRDNPRVYGLFKKYAKEAKDSGLKRFSSDAILHRIRWKATVETRGEFKVSNDVSPYYPRMLIEEDKSFATFFILRPSDADDASFIRSVLDAAASSAA